MLRIFKQFKTVWKKDLYEPFRSIDSPCNQLYLYSYIKSNEMFKSVFDMKTNPILKSSDKRINCHIKSSNDYV